MNSLDYIDKFLKFEDNENLFELRIDDVEIWNYIRDRVYNNVKMRLDNLSPVYTQSNDRKRWYLKIVNFRKYFYWNKLKPVDLFVLTHPRRIKQGELYYCIYTDYIMQEIKKNNIYSYSVFEEPFWTNFPASKVGHFYPVPTNNLIYTDFLQIESDFKIQLFKKFKIKEKQRIENQLKNVLNMVEKEFNVSLMDLMDYFLDILLYVKFMRKKFEKMLIKTHPKVIINFYCPSIPRLLLTEVANKLSIPSIDLQHGNIGISEPIHYKFYKNKKYTCLPNYMFSFGEKFVNKKYLPTESVKVIPCGYPFLELKIKEYSNNIKDKSKKNILFVSQGLLGDIMSNFAFQLSKLLQDYPEYQIIYKLHPFERNRKYDILNRNNITIIDGNENEIYYYAQNSYCQVGVYSTAVYECLQFDLPTFIIDNVYGSEEAKEVLGEENGIYYVENALECFNTLQQGLEFPDDKLKKSLWEQNSLSNMIINIDKIIKERG